MDIVVAKYNEDLEWLDKIVLPSDAKWVVYNKMGESCIPDWHIRLDNVGREAHTYLHYIATHYPNFPEHVMFLQGRPFDHEIDIEGLQHLIDIRPTEPCYAISRMYIECDGNGNPHHSGLPISQTYKEIFLETSAPTRYRFSPGAQYIVTKASLLERPRDFWNSLYNMTYNSGKHVPYTFERLWPYIFDKHMLNE